MNIYQLALVLMSTLKLGMNIWDTRKKLELSTDDKGKNGKFLTDLIIGFGLYFLVMWLYFKAGILVWE